MLTVLALAAHLGSCAPELPTAPNLQPVLQAYEDPTVEVGREIMEVWADEIEEAAEAVEDSEIFKELLDLITNAQQDLESSTSRTCNGGANNGSTCTDDADCSGGTCGTNLVLGGVCSGGTNDGNACASDGDCPDGKCTGGVTLPNPTGAFRVNYICPGWDEQQFDDGYDDSPDSAKSGSVELFATIDSGGIGRVVWGTADQCRYLVPNQGDDCEAAGCSEASFDGGVALDLGDDWVGGDVSQLLVTFVVDGDIRVDETDFDDINQSFRAILAVESGLEILVDIGAVPLEKTFNYIFAADAQLIRDATGVFGCSLQESFCFDRICEGGDNAGNACIVADDCPEGTCEQRELFSW